MPFWTRRRLAGLVLALLYMGAVSAAIARERIPEPRPDYPVMITRPVLKMRFKHPVPDHR